MNFGGLKHKINIILQKLIGVKLLKRKYKTVIIDLTLSETDILTKADKHSVRKNIERSKRKGVIIKNIIHDTNGLFEYAKMLHDSRKKLNIETRTVSQIYDEISKLTINKNYTVFMAYWNNSPVGALGSIILNKKITEQGLTRTILNDEHRLYSIDALRLALVLYGKKMGCIEYDLGGISDKTVKEINISRNKMKWNGIIREVVSFV